MFVTKTSYLDVRFHKVDASSEAMVACLGDKADN